MNPAHPLMHIMAVDPGDKHVGFADWTAEMGMISREIEAKNAPNFIDRRLTSGVQVLVIESFRLYAKKAVAQINSDMETAQMIGALKWIASVYGVQVVMQGASIKTPARAQCWARGLAWKDKDSGHASDARLHAWYYLIKQERIK